jgi:hypothetical protein
MERAPTGGIDRIAAQEYEPCFESLRHIFLAGNLKLPCPHPFFRESRVELILCEYGAGEDGHFHWHPEATEYEVVLAGSIDYREAATAKVSRFEAGDVVRVPAHTCVKRLVTGACRTLAIKVPSDDGKVHCRDCRRECAERVEPFQESA